MMSIKSLPFLCALTKILNLLKGWGPYVEAKLVTEIEPQHSDLEGCFEDWRSLRTVVPNGAAKRQTEVQMGRIEPEDILVAKNAIIDAQRG